MLKQGLLFPSELLSQSINTRLEFFRNKFAAHHYIKETQEELIRAIKFPSNENIILVFGPTGAGKTTLLMHTVKKIIEYSYSDPEFHTGRIAAAGITVPRIGTPAVNWKDLYFRALKSLDEISIEKKILYGEMKIGRIRQSTILAGNTTASLRIVLEETIERRGLYFFWFDDAHYLLKGSSGQSWNELLDTVKSLLDNSNTVFVLFGTYELLNFTALNAQLDRRTTLLHLPRYDINQPTDLAEFTKILRTFQKYLPIEKEPDLVSHIEYFFSGSLGCIGLLKEWLYKALREALDKGESTVSLKLLNKHKTATSRLAMRLGEIVEGERRWEILKANDYQPEFAHNQVKPSARQRKASSIGKPKPRRDHVGTHEND